ncbi:MAG: BlaI/MecI/CopY family transcriptional regulator [Deltaproteobacteria bacterium]|nr:BlaI/MecI/CopY family transcriptional regulator [Deltaproteobacteria bacterium]
MKKAKKKHRLLTNTELELMHILWDIDGGSVRQVMAKLPSKRDLAYTSVATILRIMEQKGFVNASKNGRSHCYIPNISRDSYEARNLKHIVKGLFKGKPIHLVRTLIDSESLSEKELLQLQDLIDSKLED